MRERLCIVSPAHWKARMGGAEFQVKCLLDHLQELDRYDIHYLAHDVPFEGQCDGHTIHRIGHGNGMPRFGYVRDAPFLYRALRTLRPDVIYQRVGCAYTGVAAFFARRAKSCLVWHAASDADLHASLKIRQRNFIRQRLDRSLLSYGIRNADRIVTQTAHQARLLQQYFDRRPDAIIANFHPEPTESIDKSGPPRVVWIGDLKRLKQPDAFLRLALALRDLPDVRFVMIGAGGARGAGSPWQESLVQGVAGAPNVDLRGQLTQQEVNAELARAHVLVNTSLYEGFSNTFVQAWMRLAAVVSLSVNPDGVFDDESVGFHAGTEQHLGEIVRRLVTDPALRDNVARSGSTHARKFHSMENAHRLEEIIGSAARTSIGRRD